MIDDAREVEDALNPEDNGEEEQSEEVEEVEDNEELAKAKELADNYKIRAEKAEKKLKDKPEPAPKKEATEENQSLTSKDVLALTGAGITNDDDVEYLLKVAKGFGMTIAEAINDQTIKAKLEEAQEERTTAEATNTKGGAKGNSKVSEASLLTNASKGKLPESDADFDRLVQARLKRR